MNFFLDTEFAEGKRKPIWWLPTIGSFNKPRWHIDLISIAIVPEYGNPYVAFSSEFKERWANEWVKKNVLTKLPEKYHKQFVRDDFGMGERMLVSIKNRSYKSLKEIANEVRMFCADKPVFYAYYADYDWVLFCSLWGSMMGLPDGFPMYCRDLKQMLDEVAEKGFFPQSHAPSNTEDAVAMLKNHIHYPEQANEHDVLDDAKWNLRLFNFIKTL
jgi:hypothetical protein